MLLVIPLAKLAMVPVKLSALLVNQENILLPVSVLIRVRLGITPIKKEKSVLSAPKGAKVVATHFACLVRKTGP